VTIKEALRIIRVYDSNSPTLLVKSLQDAIRGGGLEILLSTQQLCQYLAAAEDKIQRQRALVKHSILPGVKKRKRSETPPERMASDDLDYECTPMRSSSSD
jgi:hypothetical protein